MTNRYWSNYTTCVDTVDLAVSFVSILLLCSPCPAPLKFEHLNTNDRLVYLNTKRRPKQTVPNQDTQSLCNRQSNFTGRSVGLIDNFHIIQVSSAACIPVAFELPITCRLINLIIDCLSRPKESKLHSRHYTQEFIPLVHNEQFNVDNLVHLRCERRQPAPIESRKFYSIL